MILRIGIKIYITLRYITLHYHSILDAMIDWCAHFMLKEKRSNKAMITNKQKTNM